MSTSTCCILIIIVFFALVFHAIHLDEKRVSDRRKQDLPHPLDRRKEDRRKKTTRASRLGWAFQARWAQLKGFWTPRH
jgi:signal transduction histidine kinase